MDKEKQQNNLIMQYYNTDTNTYNIKTVNTAEENAEKEYLDFKEKIKGFENITNITEAKEYAKKFIPINNEKTFLKIGDAHCIIISRRDIFRICLDNNKEFICYNIIKPKDEKK